MAISERVDRLAMPGRPVPEGNRHITLRFVGSVDEVGLERWMAALDTAALGPSFRVGLGSVGAFPRAAKATVVWVGVNSGADLLGDLAAVVGDCAVEAGLGPEERPFRPHLTLARVRPPANVESLTETVWDDLTWRVNEVVLLQSHLGGGPARYEPLEVFELNTR